MTAHPDVNASAPISGRCPDVALDDHEESRDMHTAHHPHHGAVAPTDPHAIPADHHGPAAPHSAMRRLKVLRGEGMVELPMDVE